MKIFLYVFVITIILWFNKKCNKSKKSSSSRKSSISNDDFKDDQQDKKYSDDDDVDDLRDKDRQGEEEEEEDKQKSSSKKANKKQINKRPIKTAKKRLKSQETNSKSEERKSEIKLTFQVHKKPIRNKKYFVYKENKYEVDFELLKINSGYFYNNKKQFKNIEFINLLNEDEESCIEIPEEAIQAFIASCNNDPCQINLSSVIPLNFLSEKFQFTELNQITTEFCNKHSIQLALKSLLFKMSLKNTSFDTCYEEEIISNNLLHFIKDEQMLSLPIFVLKKITDKYFNHNEKSKINKVFDFLFKILDCKGKDASILFNNIDFKQEDINILNRLKQDYSDVFDFNMINITLANIIEKISNDLENQKEIVSKNENDLNKMKKEKENLENEIKDMKKQNIELNYEIKEKEMQNKELKDEIKHVKKQNKELKDEIDKYKNQIITNEKSITNSLNSKYSQEIIEVIGLKRFNNLNEELKFHIIDNVINNKIQTSPNENKENDERNLLIQRILYFNDVYKILSTEDIINNIKPIYDSNSFIRNQFICEYLIKNKFTNKITEHLYQRDLLNQSIFLLIKYFDEFLIEIEYPSKYISQIMKLHSYNFKTNEKYSKTVIISLVINENNYFDKDYEWNDMINICKIQSNIKIIENKLFSSFKNLMILDLNQTVNTIKSYSFTKCSNLKQITLPSSITSIEDHAFFKCFSLAQVTIFSSITSFQAFIFSECASLTHITIPSSVTIIDDNAFSKCTSLKKIIIPLSVTTIGSNAFKLCSSLKQIEISSGVTSIGCNAFSECSSLKQIIIPSSVKFCGEHIFENCISLSDIKLPSSLSSINHGFCCGCQSLKQISIPSSVVSIGVNAFSLCLLLEEITIPSFVKSIGAHAFGGCQSLKKIIIPSSITSIGDVAFSGCESLIEVNILSSYVSFGNRVFERCNSLTLLKTKTYINLSEINIGSKTKIIYLY